MEKKDEGEPATQETTQEKSKEPKETPEKHRRNTKEVVLITLKKQPSISIRELSVQCNMSVHSVQHHINRLKEIGFIRHVGSTKAGWWEVIEGPPDSSLMKDVHGAAILGSKTFIRESLGRLKDGILHKGEIAHIMQLQAAHESEDIIATMCSHLKSSREDLLQKEGKTERLRSI